VDSENSTTQANAEIRTPAFAQWRDPCISLWSLPVLFHPTSKIVILSEGTHSTTVSAAVEGPAVAFAVVLAIALVVVLAVACSLFTYRYTSSS
jgi:hypothetical protein